jgi:hypothetical protein
MPQTGNGEYTVQPWPSDVTYQGCLAIEHRPDWLREYHGLVK